MKRLMILVGLLCAMSYLGFAQKKPTRKVKKPKTVLQSKTPVKYYITIKTTNKGEKFYFTAARNGGSDLRANETKVGDWQTFVLTDLNGGELKNSDRVTIMTQLSFYFRANNGGGPEEYVYADSVNVADWQYFIVEKAGPIEDINKAISPGDQVRLRSYKKGRYITAYSTRGGGIYADETKYGTYQTFVFETLRRLTPADLQRINRLRDKSLSRNISLRAKRLCVDTQNDKFGDDAVYIIASAKDNNGNMIGRRFPRDNVVWNLSEDKDAGDDSASGGSHCVTNREVYRATLGPGDSVDVFITLFEEDGGDTRLVQKLTADLLQSAEDPYAQTAGAILAIVNRSLVFFKNEDDYLGSFVVKISNNGGRVTQQWKGLNKIGPVNRDFDGGIGHEFRFVDGWNYVGWFEVRSSLVQ